MTIRKILIVILIELQYNNNIIKCKKIQILI